MLPVHFDSIHFVLAASPLRLIRTRWNRNEELFQGKAPQIKSST